MFSFVTYPVEKPTIVLRKYKSFSRHVVYPQRAPPFPIEVVSVRKLSHYRITRKLLP